MHWPPDLLAWQNDQWLAMTVHDAKLYSMNPDTSERTIIAYSNSKADISHSIPVKLSAVMKACFEFNAGTPDIISMIVAAADLMLGVDIAASSGVTRDFQVSGRSHL